MGFAFPNVSNGQNGLTTTVLVNILDDFYRGLAPEYDIIEMSPRDLYIQKLSRMINGSATEVEQTITAIMSIEDNLDVSRLDSLTDADVARCKKYLHARDRLKAEIIRLESRK